jgi:hypothetical protein
VGVMLFALVLGISQLERRYSLDSNLGLMRWQKRAHYYLYKAKWHQQNEELAELLPVAEARLLIRDRAFNEYEVFRFSPRF